MKVLVLLFILVLTLVHDGFGCRPRPWRRHDVCDAISCTVGDWGSWSKCSHNACGTQSRSRSKTRTESCRGICFYYLSESRSCNICQNGGTCINSAHRCNCPNTATSNRCEIRQIRGPPGRQGIPGRTEATGPRVRRGLTGLQGSRVVYRRLKQTFLDLGKEPASRRIKFPYRGGIRPQPGKIWPQPGKIWPQPGKIRHQPEKIVPVSGSSTKLDIIFVMDKSGSIGAWNFNLGKTFIAELLEYFPIFPAKTRIAVVSYSTNVRLEFNFKEYINKECVQNAIRRIRYTGGLTATGNALEYTRTRLLFISTAGARSDAKKIIFVLTDGKSNEGVVPFIPAAKLKRRGVTILALGVTSNIRKSELISIASGATDVFHLKSYAALYQVTRLLQGDISTKCIHGQIVNDECGRRCRCVEGKLVQCCRLRKEFTDLSISERTRYISTVKTASTHPTYKARYEALLTLHKTIFFSNIQELDFFLPWHRWFILQYENLLREIDCRVTVPYWDWSLVAADPLASDVWNPGPHGFGGDGSGNLSCVRTGPFRVGVWSLIQSAGGGCLRRRFNDRTPDAMAVRNLILNNQSPSQFLDFEVMLRVQFHDLVHCVNDGTMCTIDSASAPEFFLHHGFVDKIWWDWQKQSDAHKFNEYFLTQTAIMPFTPYQSRAFLDLQNQPGCVCADYVGPRSSTYTAIKGLSGLQLKNIPRLPMPIVPGRTLKLFRTIEADIQKMKKLLIGFSPARSLLKSALHGRDRLRGFRITDVTKARAKSFFKVPKARRIVAERHKNHIRHFLKLFP